jgi:thiol-disulfide isomerase/thioredoxin
MQGSSRNDGDDFPRKGWIAMLQSFKIRIVAAGILTGTFVMWPNGPVRKLVVAQLEGFVPSHRASIEWVDFADIPERRGRDSVVIVEFADYSCVHCKAAEAVLDEFQDKWPAAGIGVRFVSADLLSGDTDRRAALAMCAARLSMFPTVHRLLFDRSASDGITDLESLAALLGKDVEIIESCMASETSRRRMRQDVFWAQRMGVRVTPTFVSRTGVHRGVPTVADLERMAGLPFRR